MIVKGYLERPYANGVLKYELTVQVWQVGADGERLAFAENRKSANGSPPSAARERVSYGITVSRDVCGRTYTESADDITDDADTALTLLLYLFLQNVDACHLKDVLEELLPVECDLNALICKRAPERKPVPQRKERVREKIRAI